MLILLAPHFLAAMPIGPLDLLRPATTQAGPGERPGETFPGSAFFFAEGAFDPQPTTSGAAVSHVYALESGPAAQTAAFRGMSALDSYRALNCLTSAIYYEAGNEPDAGQRAVAQVVLNRVRHPAYPHSVCGVVYQGTERGDIKCQFTFGCDGAMARLPAQAAWTRARRVAERALAGDSYAPVGLATHYHTLAVHPAWSASLKPVAVIGAHIFYRWQGSNGSPAAFTARYTGLEMQSGPAPRLWLADSSRANGPPIVASSVIASEKISTHENPVVPTFGAQGYGPQESAAPKGRDGLPESTIRPEYRNTGRPII